MGNHAAQKESGDSCMKVVVVRSPKVLRGILRVLFRIKKDEEA